MKVLLDHCVPRPLGAMLTEHEVSTTEEMGWEDKSNGKLLSLAGGAGFEVFLTVDRNLAQQQSLGELPIPVVVMLSRSNSLTVLSQHVPALLQLLGQDLQRQVYVLEEPGQARRKR